jgi:hypothetical protein
VTNPTGCPFWGWEQVLGTYAASRSSKRGNAFEDFILKCLQKIPNPIRQHCAKSEEDVRTYEINDSQLGAIARWAFAKLNPRTLVLFDKVEALAAAVVSTFFKTRRLALVDCETENFNLLNSDAGLSRAPALAVYHSETAQQACHEAAKGAHIHPLPYSREINLPNATSTDDGYPEYTPAALFSRSSNNNNSSSNSSGSNKWTLVSSSRDIFENVNPDRREYGTLRLRLYLEIFKRISSPPTRRPYYDAING